MAGGRVPRISSELGVSDRLGAWKARWGVGRLSYLVPAGLYGVGDPGPESPVLVTANYKLTYDVVRKALAGRSVWLLVLETFGINVWCAAGKGTFGTEEVVRRVNAVGLSRVVDHRRLLLPILGAPGVAAHEVRRRTGFDVRYAALRASDLPAYLDNGFVTTPAMRELTFSFWERLVLVPVELVQAWKPALFLGLAAFALGAAMNGSAASGLRAAGALLGAILTGAVVAPALLPWLPGPSFALKGAVAGLVWAAACALSPWGSSDPASLAGLLLAVPAMSGFLTLNFTGSTPFTSRSGVKRELRLALPALGSSFGCGALLWVAGSFL